MMSALAERWARLPGEALESRLVSRAGTLADYAALEEHHYRAHRPATATRVLVLEDLSATASDRFAGRAAGARPAGVLVESLPALSCMLREVAMGGRYTAWPGASDRARLLNGELRCISRVVVHPQWRGLGLAVRLVREALATATTPFTEALAAMGHVSPFFERAGMRAYHRPTHGHDERLLQALSDVGIAAVELAKATEAAARIEAMPQVKRRWLLEELRRWGRRYGPRNRGRSGPRGERTEVDVAATLQMAQRRLLCQPVYYLHDNRGVQPCR